MRRYDRIIIAYACENSGSEPGVGYFWSKAISEVFENKKILLITRNNNNVDKLVSDNVNIDLNGIDLPLKLLFIKKLLGTRVYYFIWQFIVFIQLSKNYKSYKGAIIHQVTFTPMYYPPIFFLLPFKFIWGPLGGGESYPIAYLKEIKPKDKIKEIIRLFIRHSIYINPLFYLGCIRSIKIICSTDETAEMIPKMFKKKVVVELMVFDIDKTIVENIKEKTIVIANRLIDWKATHLFVEAFSEFKNRYPTDYKLNIIGDGPYYSKIESFIDNKSIIHHKRFRNREDMLQILKTSSLFVSVSLRDSGAASLLEAMSYGIPFLVSRSGAHKIYLDKNIGFGFSLENFEKDKVKIINILKKILKDDDTLKNESKKIIENYYAYFSEKEKINRISKIIN